MRALLVANPTATAATPQGRDVIARALGSELKVDLVETQGRGHARELAATAAADGHDLVVALGGDGTVNEVVDGLLHAGPDPGAPLLAVLPGGSANVLHRALGGSPDLVASTAALLSALTEGRTRRIGLGLLERAEGGRRWFTVNAGLGLDAAVVARVEADRARGLSASPARYVGRALREFATTRDRRDPAVTLELPAEGAVGPVALAVVANTDPWTYLGARPVHALPRASFATGLDLLAPRDLRTVGSVRLLARMLSRRARVHPPGGRRVVTRHDLPWLRLTTTRPLPVQVDGDHLGSTRELALTSVPRALRVLA